jgi:hypothetical protein
MGFYKFMVIMKQKPLILCVMMVFLLYIPDVFAQISEGDIPPSFKYGQSQQLRSAVKKIETPIDFYVEDLREVDNWRAREGAPMPVGKLIPVDYTMDNSGSRSTFPGGERVWRLHLKAADAVAVMLYYKDFYIPEGGKLFIYNADESQLLGAYTHNTHPSGGLFATEFVGGDEVILEYVESEISDEKPRIHIHEIGYGYNTSALETFCRITTRSASGSCMVNINCEEGDAWQNEKKGVCHTVQRISKAAYICTASLMNNTAEDFRPLILMARHCATYDETVKNEKYEVVASSSDMQQWVFYFHMEREDCSNSSLPVVAKTMVGCELLVNTGKEGGSDGMLLQLDQMIPEEYDVFYNGWDRNETPASSGVGLHHPNGDYMKISTYGTPARETSFISSEFAGAKNACWNVTFQQTANGHGVTEQGSSGSPLYNENKLVVGTLTGGSSACSSLSGQNIYGKMSYHWDKFQQDSTHMDIWLDPLGTGVKTLAGRFRKVFKPAPVNLKAMNQGQSILLTWNAPRSTESPVSYHVYRNNQKMGEATGVSFTDSEPIAGSLVYSVSAVYAGGEESPFVTTTLSYVKFKPPSDLHAEREDINGDVKLSWNKPVYEQTIYWGTMDPAWMVGLDNDKSPFYYGQKWSAEEIFPMNEKTIRAIRFIPMEKNTYEIYISQGEHVYRQPVESSSLAYSDTNTILLNEPYVIDGSKSLIVSIYIASVKSDYPAVCDDGPVVNGKGNLCSYDGENWYPFYDEETPDEYDYNFILSAIVSSERGSLSQESRSSNGGALKYSNRMMPVASRLVRPYAAKMSVYASASSQGSIPAEFPEITKYLIYRNGSIHKYMEDPSTTDYTDKNPTTASSYYEISAFYGELESEKSEKAYITTVNDVERIERETVEIYPTRFSGSVSLNGYDAVTRVEVFSVSGKVCLVVNHPDKTIDTSSLAPGLYFFRIYGPNNQVLKVVRAVKMSG